MGWLSGFHNLEVARRLKACGFAIDRQVGIDVSDGACWFGDWEAVLREAFEVEGDGFVDVAFCLRWRRAGGVAAGEARTRGGRKNRRARTALRRAGL